MDYLVFPVQARSGPGDGCPELTTCTCYSGSCYQMEPPDTCTSVCVMKCTYFGGCLDLICGRGVARRITQ